MMRDNKLEGWSRGRDAGGAGSEPAVWMGAQRSVAYIVGVSE